MTQLRAALASTNGLILAGIVLGALFGAFFPELALAQRIIGQMFVALLKMLVVPLVFASIFVAIAGLGTLHHLKNMGLRTIGLYLLTTALSVLLAIVVMNVLGIGEAVSAEGIAFAQAHEIKPFSFEAMLLGFIPTNVFASLTNGAMMQVIVFSILFAIASLYLSDHHQGLMLDFFTGVNNAMLKMAEWVIKLTPLGVFSLIAYVVADEGVDVILGLWKYMLVVIGVILLHGLVTLPSLVAFFARVNPYHYMGQVKEAILLAFSTASSAATLPVSIEVSEHKGGVRRESAGFVLPLGATVSMDGTAAYLVVAVLYIATLAGVELSFGDQVLLGVTVVALSVGVAALPSASLVMMVVILNQIGLPADYIGLIVAVDRVLDMFRTSLNVTSDLMVTKIVDVTTRKEALGEAAQERSA
ncbi:dicarboxylate/amino acid:cation symporter [Sulfurimonas diazotrophicus]|uniref:Dicarboxylate/amino acid:cation symporter n=1 Tax=Sulfurimonas diazotrophicus TaxID=3131939 RepID=A0ABZ3HCP4_9BACT